MRSIETLQGAKREREREREGGRKKRYFGNGLLHSKWYEEKVMQPPSVPLRNAKPVFHGLSRLPGCTLFIISIAFPLVGVVSEATTPSVTGARREGGRVLNASRL